MSFLSDDDIAQQIDQIKRTPWFLGIVEKKVREITAPWLRERGSANALAVSRQVSTRPNEPPRFDTDAETVISVTETHRGAIKLDGQDLATLSRETALKAARLVADQIDQMMMRPPLPTVGMPYGGSGLSVSYAPPVTWPDPNVITAANTSLTMDDFIRAYQQMTSSYGVPPVGLGPACQDDSSGFAINQQLEREREVRRWSLWDRAGCLYLGCHELRETRLLSEPVTEYLHVGPQGQRTTYRIEDVVLARSDPHRAYGLLLGWLIEVHDIQAKACPLCGEPRDPDVEPIVLEMPKAPPTIELDGQAYQLKPEHWATEPVEACSPACATAYAIAQDPIHHRGQPALGKAMAARHQEREKAAARAEVIAAERQAGTPSQYDPADSEYAGEPRHNPWGEDDA